MALVDGKTGREYRETQASVGTWANETFPGGDPLSPRHAIRFLEEVVELCYAIGCGRLEMANVILVDGPNHPPAEPGQPARFPESPEGIAREMADCAIVLDVLAERRGVDLRTEVDAKMKINRSRRWKVNNDGTGYHLGDR